MEKPRAKLTGAWVYGERMVGRVYGHPRVVDGTLVTTSRILTRDGNVVETQNTVYEVEWAEGKVYFPEGADARNQDQSDV